MANISTEGQDGIKYFSWTTPENGEICFCYFLSASFRQKQNTISFSSFQVKSRTYRCFKLELNVNREETMDLILFGWQRAGNFQNGF